MMLVTSLEFYAANHFHWICDITRAVHLMTVHRQSECGSMDVEIDSDLSKIDCIFL